MPRGQRLHHDRRFMRPSLSARAVIWSLILGLRYFHTNRLFDRAWQSERKQVRGAKNTGRRKKEEGRVVAKIVPFSIKWPQNSVPPVGYTPKHPNSVP